MKTIILFMALVYLNAENSIGLFNSASFAETKGSDLERSTPIRTFLQNSLEKRTNIGTLVLHLLHANGRGNKWMKYSAVPEDEEMFASNKFEKGYG